MVLFQFIFCYILHLLHIFLFVLHLRYLYVYHGLLFYILSIFFTSFKPIFKIINR